MRGLRKYLAPFAPDISGASSVLYEMGGILVICDAGGCAGNVCGFDEPRWFLQKSCIYSAGLRDMDAIFGRDERLVEKLQMVSEQVDAEFACIIGTPVPAVIGTDYRALCRMAEKRMQMPVIAVETSGVRQYDDGAEKAFLALFEKFAVEKLAVVPGRIGILGATPLDTGDLAWKEHLQKKLEADPRVTEIFCYGLGDGLDTVKQASSVSKNLVVSPSGLRVAKELEKKFGTPYEVGYPLADTYLETEEGKAFIEDLKEENDGKAKVLVIHQQVLANALRDEIRNAVGEDAFVTVASFFDLHREMKEEKDIFLREEADLIDIGKAGEYTHVIGDALVQPMFGKDIKFLDVPHFACSGRFLQE